jgi:thiol:disulfide interchange protein DsbD
MIPIVLGIFGARGQAVSRAKGLLLATTYVVGMGVTYATLGTIFALIGKTTGALLADPRVIVPIVLIYLVLAASMFGAFELNLPSSWQTKLSQIGGAGYRGAFGMGLVGGFTAAPCTGPFLFGLLGVVTRSGDPVMGATLLFTHAMGIGVLFWVLAAFAISLPKSGRWMEWMKSVGGIALLAAALYFLRPLVPFLRDLGERTFTFLAIGQALTAVGLVLGAVHLSFHDRRIVQLRKALAVAITVAGIFCIIAWIIAPSRHLPWIHDEQAAYAQARKETKGVMVDFSATWCLPCAELERTFGDDGVYESLMAHYVPLKIDVTEETPTTSELRRRYGAGTLPAVVFMTPDGKVLARVNKFLDPAAFMKVIGPANEEIQRRRTQISAPAPTSAP